MTIGGENWNQSEVQHVWQKKKRGYVSDPETDVHNNLDYEYGDG